MNRPTLKIVDSENPHVMCFRKQGETWSILIYQLNALPVLRVVTVVEDPAFFLSITVIKLQHIFCPNVLNSIFHPFIVVDIEQPGSNQETVFRLFVWTRTTSRTIVSIHIVCHSESTPCYIAFQFQPLDIQAVAQYDQLRAERYFH